MKERIKKKKIKYENWRCRDSCYGSRGALAAPFYYIIYRAAAVLP